MTVKVLAGSEAVPLADMIWPCYDQVFGDYSDITTWRSELFERHAGRDGYRLAVDVTEDRVTGFAWGYVGHRGQYWSDLVHDALPPDLAETWVGGHFEVVELAVLPGHRGAGLGQALHDHLLDGVHRRCLLGTSDDPADPAVRLYRRSGWTRLGVLRPGVQVMGLDRRQDRGPERPGRLERGLIDHTAPARVTGTPDAAASNGSPSNARFGSTHPPSIG